MYTLNKAIECAIRQTQIKKSQNKLYKSIDADCDEFYNIDNGDAETLYSISSLYSQFVIDVDIDIAENFILMALSKEFPDYL